MVERRLADISNRSSVIAIVTDTGRVKPTWLDLALMLLALVARVEAQVNTETMSLYVDDPRPVSKAIRILTERHPGTIVTYEDPRYEFELDVQDVTREVRKDLMSRRIEDTPGVLVPSGGSFNLLYDVEEGTGGPDWAALLDAVIETDRSRGSTSGRFRVEQLDETFHVIPYASRSRSGQWVDHSSILDSLISLPRTEDEVNGLQMLVAICSAISETTGHKVELFTAPFALLGNYRGRISANNESARSILVQTLSATGVELTWHLYYAPDMQFYALNVMPVPSSPTPRGSPGLPAQGPSEGAVPAMAPEDAQ